MDIERRVYPLEDAELRVTDEKKGIRGTAAVFNKRTDIGYFTEEIAPNAFDGVLAKADVRGLFNHDANYVLGRTKARTMSLSVTERGLEYDIPDLPKSRADVLEAIERGDVTGNSFAFRIEDAEWQDLDSDKPHRIIKRVSELFDVGPVTFPAYPQTDVALRSLEAARAEKPPAPEPGMSKERELEKLRIAEAA